MDGRGLFLREVTFPSGEQRPALGLGTWRLGEERGRRAAEVAAVRRALDQGWRVIDTAEMYGDGGAESVVGQALAEALRSGLARADCFVVSKVLPQHADRTAMARACEASLRRLGLDRIDLYLLHWRGGVALSETVAGFEQLQRRGWIRHWGVSNFDLADMRELGAAPGGKACAANQVCYSLRERGVEHALLPWQRLQQMPLMAYSPLDMGGLVDQPQLHAIAARHRATPAQVALAWVLAQPGVMAIPKAVHALHLRHNRAAQALQLGEADRAELDRLFPPPRGEQPLAVR
jgi:diketogulonate reductase-like aldo/keto reductase